MGEISEARRQMILKWHECGYSVEDTARLLGMTEDAVRSTIDGDMGRDAEGTGAGGR